MKIRLLEAHYFADQNGPYDVVKVATPAKFLAHQQKVVGLSNRHAKIDVNSRVGLLGSSPSSFRDLGQ